MHITTKIVIASLAAAAAVGAYAISILGSEGAIVEMNPDIDPRIIQKAHRRFLKDALRGNAPTVLANGTDEEINDYFLIHYVHPLMSE